MERTIRSGARSCQALSTNEARRKCEGLATERRDLLLAYANNVNTGTILSSEERGWYYAGCPNDQCPATPHLTLNFGLRYKVQTQFFYDTSNRMSNFATGPGSPLYLQYIKSGLDTRLPRAPINTDKNKIAPRAGLAWHVPNVKDVTVSASFGLFYGQDQGSGITSRLSYTRRTVAMVL